MMIRRLLASASLLILGVPTTVLGQSQPVAIDPGWLKWNAETKTATFALIAGAAAAASPFNFNRFTDGALTWTVPVGSTVVMNFVNEDGVPHSAEIIPGTGQMPNMSTAPNSAIPRAYTIKALEGMNQGEKDVMRFTAAAPGSYRIFCGVPGHGLSGMWIWFKIDAAAKEASQLLTK
jgi:sulfocyanin